MAETQLQQGSILIEVKMALHMLLRLFKGEFFLKSQQAKYARLGVLYYVVYNPDYIRRDKHDPFEVYCLVGDAYIRQPGEPVWMPELGLGIGRERGIYEGWRREWWYDQEGNQYPTPEEIAQQEREIAQQERERAERLANKLREMGIDPNEL